MPCAFVCSGPWDIARATNANTRKPHDPRPSTHPKTVKAPAKSIWTFILEPNLPMRPQVDVLQAQLPKGISSIVEVWVREDREKLLRERLARSQVGLLSHPGFGIFCPPDE